MAAVDSFIGVGMATDPLYGLLDSQRNFLWLVDYRLPVICQLQSVLQTESQCRLVAVADCENYQHNLIDNTVCARWGLEAARDGSPMIGVRQRLIETNHRLDVVDQIKVENLATIGSIIVLLQKLEEWVNKTTLELEAFRSPFILQDRWAYAAADREWQYAYQCKKNWSAIKIHVHEYLHRADMTRSDFVEHFKRSLAQYLVDIDIKPHGINLLYV